MSAMQKAWQQMLDEYQRLDEFLKRFDTYTSSDPQQGRAVITTPVVIIGTQNHGHFELDHQDIIEHLHQRREKLKKELMNLTVLGEDVSKLRVNKDAE